jgi:hypothetical protein
MLKHLGYAGRESVVDMPKVKSLTYALAVIAFFIPMGAHAFVGAVKVACPNNNCDAVSLGQICDTMRAGSFPVGLSCENTATPGRGTPRACGAAGGTCTPFGALVRTDLLGSYCFGSNIGGNNDAVVTCNTTAQNTADEERTRK